MQYSLMELPYPKDALEPMISARTLEYHYGKHHAGYVEKLNGLIKDTEFETKSLIELIKHAEGAIFNNAAQVYNHDFYWTNLSNKPTKPSLELESHIRSEFGSMDAFEKEFQTKALGLFGSGWVWLCIDKQENLSIVTTSNADNPIRSGLIPLMVCDVWEHAYYLDYQNARAEYLANFFKLLNWKFISFNFANHQEHAQNYFSHVCKENTPYCEYLDSLEEMEKVST
ncbi:MAG: superoxide dismutase [Helicobacteraceae bacterium]|nr:superoxide dismutase [Helicobacteraceae bacterium]